MYERNIRILLVDDDEVDRAAVRRHIETNELPYELRTAVSKDEALDRLREAASDVVLLDYDLSDGTGLELLSQLDETPTIIITGHGSEQIAIEAMRRGACDYLIKDVESHYLKMLPVTIRNVLRRKRSEWELRESESKLRHIYENAPVMMYSIDEEGRIYNVNEKWLQEMGFTRDEVIGHKIDLVMTPESGQRAHRKEIPRFWRQGYARDVPYQFVRKDGTVIDVLDHSIATTDPSGRCISLSVVHDVTAQKRAAEQIANSLKEKEVLLREVHHRVKNNMQIVVSLLRLQSRTIQNETAREALVDSQNRIKAMALIHETLYQSENLTGITLRSYVHRLVRNLLSVHGPRGRSAQILVDVGDAALDIDTAVPVGLIINELVSNSLKHAFPDRKPGEVRVTVHPTGEEEIELTVADDGIGLPEELDPRNTATLGLRLVTRLAEDQLGGKLEFRRGEGSCCMLRFHRKTPLPENPDGPAVNRDRVGEGFA